MRDFFKGLEELVTLAFWMLTICVPLAIWKVIDIIIWLFGKL